MKKVLYITYDGLTDPLGQSQILPYLQDLAKLGYQFTILSFEKKSRYLKEGQLVQTITDKAGIRWVPCFFTHRPPVISKMYDRWKMVQVASALYKEFRFDLIHCRSYIASEVGLHLKQRFGVKMLFDMRGFWADEKVDNGQWNQHKALYRHIYRHYKQKEKQFLLHADGIVSLTDAAKMYLNQQPDYAHLPIDVIPCCADLQHFNYNAVPREVSERFRKSLGIPPGAKVITYLGSLGGWYMTGEMFRFFALLQQKDPDYVMLILTKDSADLVRREAAEYGVPMEKLFTTYSTRGDLPAYLSFCTVSIFFIRNSFSKKASSPTKHAELMGMGIPVICNDIGDTGNVIEKSKTGMVVDSFDEATFQRAIGHLPDLESMDKAIIRESAFDLFDLKNGVQRYAALYERIFHEKKVLTGLSHA